MISLIRGINEAKEWPVSNENISWSLQQNKIFKGGEVVKHRKT